MRFYCKNCDTDFEPVDKFDDSLSRRCPNCDRLIRNKKPRIHRIYAKTWCDGILAFESGNRFGCNWRCKKCGKGEVLQTDAQIKVRGIIKI